MLIQYLNHIGPWHCLYPPPPPRYILDFAGFHFPIALTLSHMAFCSAVATALIKLGFVKAIDMDNTMYFK